MPPSPETDGRTLEGVAVSSALLGAVHEYAKGSSEAAIRMEGKIDTMSGTLTELRTSSTTLAEIAKARREEELLDRQAKHEQEKREAEQSAQAKARVAGWFSENWKYLVLIFILVFNAPLAQQLQAIGLLPSVAPVAPMAPPSPAPAAVESPAPVDESATTEDGE